MKKLAQHIPALMTFACTSVFAQSTVTLYGILSEGIGWTSNEAGHSNVKVFTGPNQNNRVGFRVIEDLGGGNRVVGVLENGSTSRAENSSKVVACSAGKPTSA